MPRWTEETQKYVWSQRGFGTVPGMVVLIDDYNNDVLRGQPQTHRQHFNFYIILQDILPLFLFFLTVGSYINSNRLATGFPCIGSI